jgi:hypothetical protein
LPGETPLSEKAPPAERPKKVEKLGPEIWIEPEVTIAPLWRRTVPRRTPVLAKTRSRVSVVWPVAKEPSTSGERTPVVGWKAKSV